MVDNVTVVLGLPIPSADPFFLAIVCVHIIFGLSAVATGAVAMLSRKGPGRHARFGALYFWSLAGVYLTLTALSLMRLAEDYHLFILGTLSLAAACLGRAVARRHPRQWPSLHLATMGASYILLLTGFYVDNGPNLPLWRALPPLAFWFLPSIIGVPLILYVWTHHPLTSARQRKP